MPRQVHCQQPGCQHTWPQDPVLSVSCPNCGAAPGRVCKRPSEHQVWYSWGRFHYERDFAAALAGKYHHHCTVPHPDSCGTCYPDTAQEACERLRANLKR